MRKNFNEASFQTKFGHWLRNNRRNETYELKIVKNGLPFSFDQVKNHQIDGLLRSMRGIYIKIPDGSSKTGHSNRKPFDCLWVVVDKAFVAIMFYKFKEKQYFYRIPICNFMELRDVWAKKSIHEEELAIQPGVEKFIL